MSLTTPPLSNTWREFTGFIRAPRRLDPGGLLGPGNPGRLTAMVIFLVVGLGLLAPLMALWEHMTGISGPDAFGQFKRGTLILIVVLFAPALEEVLFRGWLNGRTRVLWLLACVAVGGLAMWLAYANPPLFSACFFATVLAAVGGWFALRKRGRPAWFDHAFAPLFWTSVALFGFSHLLNFTSPGLATLPLVLPQLWAGMTLGFVRMRVGLPGSIIAHAVSNAITVTFALSHG